VIYLPNLKTKYRLASLVAYGLSLLILHFDEPIAAKAYNDLCSSQGIKFHPGEPVGVLVVGLMVFAIPLLLARSNALILANLIIGSITVLTVSGLSVTAEDTPMNASHRRGLTKITLRDLRASNGGFFSQHSFLAFCR
jgi:hypothetical protein